jgi:hypothetical protein
LIEIRLGWRVRNSHDGSYGGDIGDRRRPGVNPLYITGMVWPPAGAPEMLIVVAMMRPGAITAIGMPTGVIWPIGIG